MTKKKICMLGAFGVGKSSLVKRYLHSTFDERYHATLGARIEKQRVSVAGHDTTLMIWDFAGEDEIVDFPVSYVRGASGLIVVADGTRPDTLHTAINIHERACQQWGQIPTLIALNKHDMKERWEVDEADLRELRCRCGPLMATSAKSGHQAQRIFETLAHRMVMADVSVS